MGGACGARGDGCLRGFGWGAVWGSWAWVGDGVEVGLGGMGVGGVGWIRLARGRAGWWAFVGAVWAVRFHRGILFGNLSDGRLFGGVSCTME
jgi:hypothetical protein